MPPPIDFRWARSVPCHHLTEANVQPLPKYRSTRIRIIPGLRLLATLLVFASFGLSDSSAQTSPDSLKNLSLEDLSQIEVTTPSKEPVRQ